MAGPAMHDSPMPLAVSCWTQGQAVISFECYRTLSMICQVTCVHCRARHCQRIHWVAPDGALVSQEACDRAARSLWAVMLAFICRHLKWQSTLDS